MTELFVQNAWNRRDFSTCKSVMTTPGLMKLQIQSYEEFLQKDVPPARREDKGLQAVFKSVFPIYDFNKTVCLEYVNYSLKEPKYSVKECRQRGLSYEAPLKVTVRLIYYDVNENEDDLDENEGQATKTVSSIKEQEVYLGNIPIMAPTGSFIYNGTERVIVSQLHRSPGIIFEHDSGKKHSSGKLLYSARIIPHRGSWLDFEFDHKNILYARIDRKRKLHVTVILKAMGLSNVELLREFYHFETLHLGDSIERELDFDLLVGSRALTDIISPKDGSIIVKKGKKYTRGSIKKLREQGLERLPASIEEITGKVSAEDLFDEETGEVLCLANETLTESKISELMSLGVKEIKVLYIDMVNYGDQIRNTLLLDKTPSQEDAFFKIFERLRPGEPPTLEAAQNLFEGLFFDSTKYDLSKVGRMKINYKFGMDVPVENTVLTNQDILNTVKYLVNLNNGKGSVDDIDHLGNRRVRAVGELLENQFRVGLVRMERAVKERMSIQELDTLMPHDLVNQKPVSAAIKEFFGSSQLSQFMDQTNPLSEVTHKRRLSALGPGGLTRERAGFEVRDVHSTHYGRMCPVETPEGPNIGLITSLATYAQVSEYGFIETPYRYFNEDGTFSTNPRYFSAFEEEDKTIAQTDYRFLEANSRVDDIQVSARKSGEFSLVNSEEVEFMDVSPQQMISIATSLIPFLEHDDANRALMGSNMMRQAVPVVVTDAPIVGTGVEAIVARDSGAVLIAKNSGKVIFVDSNSIVIQRDSFEDNESGIDFYKLIKYQRTNQNTCNNQRSLVKEGDYVRTGTVIADGPATHFGDLALGQNVNVAFMPWKGYNYEDSILISEGLLSKDVFTSIHIEDYEIEARDTKLGKEEITRDIPNVSEEALKDLDEAGIIRIGAIVKPGDILVGKITPKGETQLSPEEKLLKAIFGDKAGDVKDTSLRVPSSVRGTVIDAKVFSREGVELDSRSKSIIEQETDFIRRDEAIEIRAIQSSAIQKIVQMFKDVKTTDKLVSEDGSQELLGKGQEISESVLKKLPFELIGYLPLEIGDEERLGEYFADVRNRINRVRTKANEEVAKLHRGDELLPGVIKKVVISIAIKRKLQPGDKMAGRHGNKGVISNVLPLEDMPFMADGTPVDIVLNPLGVPSRMNVGQLLELHLGWAGVGLGNKIKNLLQEGKNTERLRDLIKRIYPDKASNQWLDKASAKEIDRVATQLSQGVRFSTAVFDGAKEKHIEEMFELADLEKSGRSTLFDGITGDVFSEEVTVGSMYMLKLHHLVDEKIHARSTGPYSLVTQQPLGGKAQFGGQRLGEMEVWALEAYGAAYTLQEFLTVKSDDVVGRTRMYESIVKGEKVLEPGLPESFNVLIRELQALALDVKLEEETPELI